MSDTVTVVEIDPTRRSPSGDPTRATSAAVDTAPDQARWVALVVLCIGMLMIVLDATVVNVAFRRSRRTSASPRPAWRGWSTPT